MPPWRGVMVGWEHGPAFATSITEAETARLCELAAGRRVLEVGSAYGYSAVVMARAGAEHVTAVDPHHAIPSSAPGAIMAANVESLGLAGRVEMIREFSGDVLPAWAELGTRFGLVFIDGDHRAPAAADDARMSVPLLEPGGVLAFHDYQDPECPGVAEALDAVFPEGPDRVTGTLWEKAF